MNSIRQRYAFLSCSETAAVPHRFCLETRDSIEALRRSPRFQKVEAMTCVDPSLLSLLRRRHRPLDFFACFKRSLQLSQYHVVFCEGGTLRPTQPRWNHSFSQLSASQATISP